MHDLIAARSQSEAKRHVQFSTLFAQLSSIAESANPGICSCTTSAKILTYLRSWAKCHDSSLVRLYCHRPTDTHTHARTHTWSWKKWVYSRAKYGSLFRVRIAICNYVHRHGEFFFLSSLPWHKRRLVLSWLKAVSNRDPVNFSLSPLNCKKRYEIDNKAVASSQLPLFLSQAPSSPCLGGKREEKGHKTTWWRPSVARTDVVEKKRPPLALNTGASGALLGPPLVGARSTHTHINKSPGTEEHRGQGCHGVLVTKSSGQVFGVQWLPWPSLACCCRHFARRQRMKNEA